MKFYGKGVLWDPKNNKAKYEFIRGEFETDDPGLIEEMIAAGFEHDGDKPEPKDLSAPVYAAIKPAEPSIEELRRAAKEKGIRSYHNMKRETLIEKLKDVK